MKLAIVGTGISSLTCAHLLHEDHDLTLFEAGAHIGGHTNTIDVKNDEGDWRVDTGFIVFNDWTYPNFIKLLGRLGVASQASDMSFSVRSEATGMEYNGTSLDALFAQRVNLFRPSFLRMVRDILRFNSRAPEVLNGYPGADTLSLAEYVSQNRYSAEFVRDYLIPIGASIWSADPGDFARIPARFFIGFLKNHGMLSVDNRPQWRVVKGGSRTYVDALVKPFRDRIRLSTPVRRIERHGHGVRVGTAGAVEEFDQVIIGCHSGQALRMLADPSGAEREILGAIPYQPNRTILHTDAAMLPRSRKAWAAWNYHQLAGASGRAAITYSMNILQSLPARDQFCVTLNREEDIDPRRVIQGFDYEHPVFRMDSVAAQRRWDEINGVNRTWYCGAYWGFGFHEDGVKSGLRVCGQFGKAF